MGRWIVLWLLLLAAPALAQDGWRYENLQWGFALDVPAGFVAAEAQNGGQAFELQGERVTLWVGGAPLRGPLSGAVARHGRELEAAGWRMGEQTSTPGWASFAATKGSRMRLGRMIRLCEGRASAIWQIELSAAQFTQLSPVLGRLERALRPLGC
jgi:hypothetical protein